MTTSVELLKKYQEAVGVGAQLLAERERIRGVIEAANRAIAAAQAEVATAEQRYGEAQARVLVDGVMGADKKPLQQLQAAIADVERLKVTMPALERRFDSSRLPIVEQCGRVVELRHEYRVAAWNEYRDELIKGCGVFSAMLVRGIAVAFVCEFHNYESELRKVKFLEPQTGQRLICMDNPHTIEGEDFMRRPVTRPIWSADEEITAFVDQHQELNNLVRDMEQIGAAAKRV